MPSIPKWTAIAAEQSKNSKSYRAFYNGIGNRKSVICAYSYGMSKFMAFLEKNKYISQKEDYDKLLSFSPKKITAVLRDYTFDSNLRVKGVSVRSYLNGPELFFTMNDKIWNERLVKKAIRRDDTVPGGRTPATSNDVENIIKSCKNHFERALYHFFFSTGIRPGAVIDPVLRMRHLHKMPRGCYAIKVYDESKEGYWAFLTPEAANAFDDYIKSRKLNGEIIDEESVLFRPVKTGNKPFNQIHITASIAREITYRIIKKAGIKRVKYGNRYDKAVLYMFRKRFNKILKLDNQINSNIAERMMAHSIETIKLDTNYFEPTKEEIFVEFEKAISELTVNPTERQKLKIRKQEKKILELEEKENVIESLQEKVKNLEEKWITEHFHSVPSVT